MNILVYSLPFFPSLGGLERNTLTLCLALKELGHDVQLFTETSGAENDDDYPFEITRSDSRMAFARHVWKNDMLIVNGGVSMRTIPFAWLCKKEYMVIYHTYRGHRREGQGTINALNNWLRKKAAEQASANVFTSSYAKENTAVGNSPAHVILNPIDKRLQEMNDRLERKNARLAVEDDAAPQILFAGRMIEGKGVFVLMDALERLDGAMRLGVTFAGTGPATAELKSRAASLSSIAVRFPGNLDDESLLRAYRKASVLIVPTSTHNEGNPLVIAEALYAGTPVIASNQPPMIEAVGEAGFIFENGNDRELSELIEKVLGDEAAYRALKEKAHERKSLFEYTSYVGKIGRLVGPAHAQQDRSSRVVSPA